VGVVTAGVVPTGVVMPGAVTVGVLTAGVVSPSGASTEMAAAGTLSARTASHAQPQLSSTTAHPRIATAADRPSMTKGLIWPPSLPRLQLNRIAGEEGCLPHVPGIPDIGISGRDL
jgi:hypothetical protein